MEKKSICKGMLDGSVGTMRALCMVSISGMAISAHSCVQALTLVGTQGRDQRLPPSLEALQGCSIHRVERLQWKIKRNTCVLLGSEHPGRRGAILNCLWEFMTRSNGGKVR